MKQVLLISLLIASTAQAQVEYQPLSLPSAMTENAHAVIRRYETTFTVKSPDEATQRIRRVVTILDGQGDDLASLSVGYDKLSRINDFTGTLYDATGKVVKKLKKTDIADLSTYMDYNLYDDQRQKVARFPRQPGYPYTVEFVVETTERNLMFYPSWMPQSEEHVAVENASFTVVMPPDLPLRYKEMNMPARVSLTVQANGSKVYAWQLANLPAVHLEPLSPPVREQLPMVYTAPALFEVQDYKGKLNNWDDLSRFYYKLNEGRDAIPADLRQRVLELTKQETTTIGKVRTVYRFLQEHTRYVSVQLGIGGWQAIEANKVAASKYGDCKALTNYAQSLLKVAGVVAHPVLVRAGKYEPDILTDFPSFQFNHVILCVPDGRDTTFLECTDGNGPAGYVGSFTGNRHALLILSDGGRLIQTPVYRPVDNLQQRRITVTLTDNGDAIAQVLTRYTGLQQDECASALHQLNRDDLRSWMIRRIQIPAFELNTFTHTDQAGLLPSITESMNLLVHRWATASGTRLFLPLNLMSALNPAAPLAQARQAPLHLSANYDFDDSDTITYQLPKGYVPEYQVEPLVVESLFGRYAVTVSVNADRVSYIRRVTMHRGRFPASAYGAWVDFRRKIAKSDRSQMVFVKAN